MVDFINEVEEELRKDEYNRLLRKYGPYLVGLILIVMAVATFLEWRDYSDDRLARATSAAYVDATSLAAEGDMDGALGQFIEISQKASPGYAGLSLMRAATIELERNNRGEAVRYFDQAARVLSSARHKQLAELKAAYILAGNGSYADVQARVSPLAEKDQPYEFLARELLGFSAMELEDFQNLSLIHI